MDAKVTLSINEDVIEKAKMYAESKGISLSRLTEILLRKATAGGYKNIEDIPVADWVYTVSEGATEYITERKRKNLKEEYFNSKK
ncbi:MAG: DUF6364 family protein [Taibaiella sp.]|nr:DUF6364 family protein [Taibaiella sp.]